MLFVLPVVAVFAKTVEAPVELSAPVYEASSSMMYFKTGPGLAGIIPKAGIGYRKSFGRHGFDVSYASSVLFSDIGHRFALTGFEADYLLYFDENSPNRGYFGVGAKPGMKEDINRLYVTPEVLLGYQFAQKGKMKGFVQLEIRPISMAQDLILSPVTVGLGIGF
ncbi:MAG: hypothetical protein SP1CHLAM54_11400 [Chlamydiia bacterium]|nr:hypothetical protein [Chlamydiia bacterium]MCH9616043.1 hypothetical protein [Chlamydiia bacterium]MCH9629066.1 hypothetical protein [Chlamydiia bacterium]